MEVSVVMEGIESLMVCFGESSVVLYMGCAGEGRFFSMHFFPIISTSKSGGFSTFRSLIHIFFATSIGVHHKDLVTWENQP